MIIISEEIINDVEFEFRRILERNSIKDIKSFKWSKFNNNDKVNVFKEFFQYIAPFLLENKIYIHTLIWNVNDSRHSVFPRDDNKNLEIMYYKIIYNFSKTYLNNENFLFIYPDRQNTINWQLIEQILEKKGFYNMKYGREIYIEESNTKHANLIQIADIFAGIGRTSYADYEEYKIRGDVNQSILIPFEEDLSVKTKTRFRIIKFLHDWTKRNKLQISINSNNGFKSYKKGPLNFWYYEPQHENDKAPLKYK